jgi:hypothetical protein
MLTFQRGLCERLTSTSNVCCLSALSYLILKNAAALVVVYSEEHCRCIGGQVPVAYRLNYLELL